MVSANVANYSEARKDVDPFFERNERITNVKDDEALQLLHSHSSIAESGFHPTTAALHRMWFLCVQHFLGLQNSRTQTIDQLMDIFPAAAPSGYNANLILRMVMAEVARLSASPADVDVIPKSPDIEDQIGAQVGDRFLQHVEDKYQMKKVRRKLNLWRSIAGTGFLYTDWNERAGGEMEFFTNPMDGSMIKGDAIPEKAKAWLRKMGSSQKTMEGALEISALPPFAVLAPFGYEELADMPWLVIEQDRSLDWIWTHYPDEARDVRPDDFSTTAEGLWWRRLQGLVGSHGFQQATEGGRRDSVVRVATLWIPPSGRCPDGFRITGTKTKLLDKVKHPFKEKQLDIRFPVEVCRRCPVPGRFWGTGLVEHLMGPQNDYNRTRTQLMEHRDVLARPVWMAPQGIEWTTTRLEVGDVIEYRNGGYGKPELQNPPAISAIHVEALDRGVQELQTIASQGDVSQGQVPQGARSGVALQTLADKDMSVMRVVVEEQEDCFQRGYEKVLSLAWKFMSTPQMIRVYGEFRQADVAIFKGADLNGNVFVRIRPGSMMPKNKAETQEMLTGMLQNGALDPINNRRDKKFVWEAMEIGGADKMFLEEAGHRRRARIEDQMFLKPQVDRGTGMPQAFPDVNDDDDHEAHIEEHMLFKVTDAYEALPPMRKMAFEAHLAKHKAAIAALMQAQMLMQSAAVGPDAEGGAGGAPGGGSPPKKAGKASQPAQRSETPGTFKSQEKS